MPIAEEFVAWLRFALRHMYEPSVLQNSPLIAKLGLAACATPTSELRRLLAKEVRAMTPTPDTPPDSEVWRAHEILLYRYVEHYSELQVADQLGISTRHLRREERKAVEALAERLRPRLADGSYTAPAREQQGQAPAEEVPPSAVDSELAWLSRSGSQGPIQSSDVLPAVLELMRLLAERYGVQIQVAAGDDQCPLLVAHPVALKQILLNLLTVAIRVSEGKQISVSVKGVNGQVELRVQGLGIRPDPEHVAENAANLDMARRLAEGCGGRLSLDQHPGGFVAVASFPGLAQEPVLVIDDNADTVRLLQRYAEGTRYRVYGAPNLQRGLALASEVRPRAILLDVMMPDLDGWEALGQLRQHPATTQVPVVVCTILSQRELALSLGASGFLGKPLTRLGFLEGLAGLIPDQAQPRS